jgi:hypothetical protein
LFGAGWTQELIPAALHLIGGSDSAESERQFYIETLYISWPVANGLGVPNLQKHPVLKIIDVDEHDKLTHL